MWSDELLQPPLAQVCVAEIDPPHAECLTDGARRLAEDAGLAERLVGRLRGEWERVDTTRSVRRVTTARYRLEAVKLLRRQAIWGAGVWGVYYLLVWIGSGFRGHRRQ